MKKILCGCFLFFFLCKFVSPRFVLAEKDYLVALKVITSNFEPHEVIHKEIERRVKSGRIGDDSYLEIGPGMGNDTEIVSKYFKHTTIVEPNEEFVKILKDKGFRDVHISKWQEFDETNKYDFVLSSHVLYHIPDEEWLSFISKMMKHLNPEGCLLLVMEGSNSESVNFKNKFKKQQTLKEISSGLDEDFFTQEFVYSRHDYFADNFDDFYTMLRFIVLEDCFTTEEYQGLSVKEKGRLDGLIRNRTKECLKEDGNFRMEWKQEMLFICRNKNDEL